MLPNGFKMCTRSMRGLKGLNPPEYVGRGRIWFLQPHADTLRGGGGRKAWWPQGTGTIEWRRIVYAWVRKERIDNGDEAERGAMDPGGVDGKMSKPWPWLHGRKLI